MTIPPAAVIALRALRSIVNEDPADRVLRDWQVEAHEYLDRLDALLARVEPQVTFIDPSSVQGQRAIRNAAFLTPTTQGDPVPDSAEDVESHPWKAAAHEVPDWLLDRLRAALNEARITISVDHPARVQVEAAMADLDFYRTTNPATARVESPPQEQEPN